MRNAWPPIAIVAGLLAIAAFTFGDGAANEQPMRPSDPAAVTASDSAPSQPGAAAPAMDAVPPDPAIAGHQ